MQFDVPGAAFFVSLISGSCFYASLGLRTICIFIKARPEIETFNERAKETQILKIAAQI